MTRMAECHPDRKHWAKGLCSRCYDKARAQHPQRVEQVKRKNQRFRDRHPNAMYASNIWHKYRLTPEQVQAMKEAQNNRCAVCECELPTRFHIDHCHTTNRVRGLLCARCNQGLWYVERPDDWIEKARRYLTAPPGAAERIAA